MKCGEVSLLEKIKDRTPNLSPKQRTLAKYIVENYKNIAFMSSMSLAKNSGVSEATVTRLAYSLGYSGYSELQSDIQKLVFREINPIKKYSLDNNQPIYNKVISLEKEAMDEMIEGISESVFNDAIDLLFRARDVLIVGTQFNKVVAEYASIYLNVFKENVHKVLSFDPETFNSIQGLSPHTVALVFSFPRYPKQTQEILKYLQAQNISIIGITDSLLSPIAAFSSVLFVVPQKFVSFIDPYAATTALIHSLLVGVFLKDTKKSKTKLKKYDDFLARHDTYVLEKIELAELL